MSAARDGGLRPLFRQHMLRLHPGTQWTPVETGGSISGVPDSEYMIPGHAAGWVEFKKADAWAVSLRPHQVSWLATRSGLGGRATLAVRRAQASTDELWLLDGLQVAAVAEGGLRAAEPLLCLPGGPRRWDWVAVSAVLRR